MSFARHPFDPTFEELPDVIPIFPLGGVLLLPRGRLPLNIFELRYLNMVRDSMANQRIIGMIQPDPLNEEDDVTPLFRTGCAGRITSFSETPDGRYLITLRGICRFHVLEELPQVNGYRRVVPDWSAFYRDLQKDDGSVNRERLRSEIKRYFNAKNISADWEAIEATPDEQLVTSLSMICPFAPSEKQALLEVPDLAERAQLIMGLMEMSALEPHGGDGPLN